MVAPASALDNRQLDALRTQAARDPRGAARQAAVQFESLFTQMVLKSMRDASPKAEGGSMAQDNFTAMLDGQFAKQFAGRPGGLAEVIEKQLTRHMGNLPAPQPANQAVLDAAAPAAAAPSANPAAPAASPASSPAEFIKKMLPHAQEAERRTGVPASFILGQAALESGWGKGEIRNGDGSPSFNLFGIKATPSWQGNSTDVMTTEFEGGVAQRQRASFRSYASYADAFTDYARMLSTQKRYANVVANAATPEQFATGMQRAGYATDPQYASKLARTINTALNVQRALGAA
jgi:flagellar protein FlgJ